MKHDRRLVITVLVAVVVVAIGIGVMALTTNDTDEPAQEVIGAPFLDRNSASTASTTGSNGRIGDAPTTAIKLVDDVPSNAAATVEFQVSQGDSNVARIGVNAGASETVPTTSEFTAQAFTEVGGQTLSTNTVSFRSTSVTLLAQVLTENGFYDFQLIEQPGTQPSAVTCENTWSAPVQFRLQKVNSPLVVATIVDEHNYIHISTAQQYTVSAIVDGIASAAVTVDENATVTARPSIDGAGVTLVVT